MFHVSWFSPSRTASSHCNYANYVIHNGCTICPLFGARYQGLNQGFMTSVNLDPRAIMSFTSSDSTASNASNHNWWLSPTRKRHYGPGNEVGRQSTRVVEAFRLGMKLRLTLCSRLLWRVLYFSDQTTC